MKAVSSRSEAVSRLWEIGDIVKVFEEWEAR